MGIFFPAPCIRNCFQLFEKERQKIKAHLRDTHTHFPSEPPQASLYLNVNKKECHLSVLYQTFKSSLHLRNNTQARMPSIQQEWSEVRTSDRAMFVSTGSTLLFEVVA